MKIGGVAGAGMLVPWKVLVKQAYAQLPGGTLNPALLPKYVTPLVIPPAMPRTSKLT